MITNTKKKLMKTFNHLLIVLFSASMILVACKKNETPSPLAPNNKNTTANADPTQMGTLLMHLHTYIDKTEVDGYNITYTNSEGRKMSLSRAQFYISDIQIEKLDGAIISIGDKKMIKVRELQSYEVGEVAIGNYKSLRFKVGLPSSTNALNPSVSGADSTILNRPEMWFNTTPQPDGYVYLNAQGLIDTSADLSEKMAPFVYKIGTDSHYKQIVINQNFGISPKQVTYFHMLADYSKLFEGITLNNNSNLNISTVSDNSTVLAEKVADNILSMFFSE